MSNFAVFFSLPLPDGTYGDFFEVTDDVLENSLQSISEDLAANDFDVGGIVFGNLKIKFRNESAKYSEPSNPSSLFTYTRDKTLVKVEWDVNNYGVSCGWSPCGFTKLSKPVTVFKGLIEENTTDFDVADQTVRFTVLSLDSIIKKQETPFSSLLVTDDAETLLYKILNIPGITKFFTVDADNISVPNNFIPDDISELEDTDCLEAIQEILKLANAILFIRDDILYIRSRESDEDTSFTFYGPSSDSGIENIVNISKYGPGINRCFNFWVWEDTNLSVSFADSIERNGLRKKVVSSKLITDDNKRLAVLQTYLNEFGFPATELTIEVSLTTPLAKLGFLNKVNIDYPPDILENAKDRLSSVYGTAVYDISEYVSSVDSLFIATTQEWKILNRRIKTGKHTLEFKIREIL